MLLRVSRFPLEVLVALTVASLCAAAGAQAPAPTAPATWDLSHEFPTEASWDAARARVESEAAALGAMRGHPISNAGQLADLVVRVARVRRLAGRMARFAVLELSLDDGSALARQRVDAAENIEANVEAAVSWSDATIAALGEARLASWSASEPLLANELWVLHRIRGQAARLANPDAVAAAPLLRRASIAPVRIYGALARAPLVWPDFGPAAAGPQRLDPDAWVVATRSPDPAVRRAANSLFFDQLGRLEDVLGALATSRLETNAALARVQGFDDPMDSFFVVGDGLPAGAYRQLTLGARAHPEILARLARYRGGPAAQLGDLSARDTYTFSPETFEQASQVILDSLAPLGVDYRTRLSGRLSASWMDWAPRPHKSGGGVFWQVGGGHPYASFVYDGTAGGERTLAAVAALTMFYADLPPDKLPDRREADFPVASNAVWYMAQLMHTDHALVAVTDRAQMQAILSEEVYRLWRIFYQNAAYTDAEAMAYEAIANGRPPTGAQLSEAYLAALGLLYPPSTGVVMEPGRGREILVLANSYYGEVLTEWAFAMAGACQLAERVEAGDRNAIDAITHPLDRANSFLSYDVLRDAGVDLQSSAPYDCVARRISRDLDRLEQLAADR